MELESAIMAGNYKTMFMKRLRITLVFEMACRGFTWETLIKRVQQQRAEDSIPENLMPQNDDNQPGSWAQFSQQFHAQEQPSDELVDCSEISGIHKHLPRSLFNNDCPHSRSVWKNEPGERHLRVVFSFGRKHVTPELIE